LNDHILTHTSGRIQTEKKFEKNECGKIRRHRQKRSEASRGNDVNRRSTVILEPLKGKPWEGRNKACGYRLLRLSYLKIEKFRNTKGSGRGRPAEGSSLTAEGKEKEKTSNYKQGKRGVK